MNLCQHVTISHFWCIVGKINAYRLRLLCTKRVRLNTTLSKGKKFTISYLIFHLLMNISCTWKPALKKNMLLIHENLMLDLIHSLIVTRSRSMISYLPSHPFCKRRRILTSSLHLDTSIVSWKTSIETSWEFSKQVYSGILPER